jgi:hypothetical protein
MLQSPAANQNGMNIEVTPTSTSLFDLINTAQGTSGSFANYSSAEDGINLTIEGDDIRVGYSLDPTPSLGRPMYKDNTYYIRGTTLQYLKLISTTASNSKVSIELGCSEPGEVGSSSPTGTSSGVADNSDLISTASSYDSITLTNADTEYVYTLTTAAKGFELVSEDCNHFKYMIGGSTDDTATKYTIVKDGSMYWRPTMQLAIGEVLRFRSEDAGQVVRIALYN